MNHSRRSFLTALGLAPAASMLAPWLDSAPHELEDLVELEQLGRRIVGLDPGLSTSFIFTQARRAILAGNLNPASPMSARLLGERTRVLELAASEQVFHEAREFHELRQVLDQLDPIAGPVELSAITWSRPPPPVDLRTAEIIVDAGDVTFGPFEGLAVGCLLSFGARLSRGCQLSERPCAYLGSGFPALGSGVHSTTIAWASGGMFRLKA